jgi:DNA-binding winged helix-turn-helix (wHTH) protein
MDTGVSVPYSMYFLDYELVPAQRRLWRGGRPVTIGARAFDLLALLAGNPGEVLSNRRLMEGVWPRTVVVEANLRVQIAALRKLLGCDGPGSHIVNVAGRGYCFTAPVQRQPTQAEFAQAPLSGVRRAADGGTDLSVH